MQIITQGLKSAKLVSQGYYSGEVAVITSARFEHVALPPQWDHSALPPQFAFDVLPEQFDYEVI